MDSTQPDPIMRLFAYEHLSARLQEVSKPFADFVQKIILDLPPNPERTACIQKLLEAKNAALRAKLYEL